MPVALAEETSGPDYSKQIVPIFNKYCVACHAADAPEGDFVLDSYDALLKGGKRGVAISAGQPDQSRLIRMLTGEAKPIMPPDDGESERPKPEEIELLKQWVAAGAKGPTGKAPDPTVLVTPSIKPTAEVRRAITAVSYSPQGDLIAVGRYRTVELLASGTRAVRQSIPQRGAVNELAFTQDGTRLIAASGETGLVGEVTIWNIAERKRTHTLRGHKDIVYALAVSPNGKLLATGSYDQTIKLWDLDSGSELKTLTGHNGAVFGLAFHKNGRVLASASGDRTVKLWDIERGVRLDTFGQPTLDQYTVAFSPDGRFVAAGGVDNRIRVWKLSDTVAEGTNEIVVARFAHEQPIVKLSYSPDGQTIVTAAEDRKVKLWQADKVAERQLLEPQPDVAAAVAFSPDNKIIVVGRLDGSLVVYNTADGAVVAPTPLAEPELAALSPRGIERGKPAELRLTGKNLGEVTKVTFADERLSAKLTNASANGDEATIELTAAVDLPRGAYDVSVENAAGRSAKLKLYVDDIPQVAEASLQSSTAVQQELHLPASVWGSLAKAGEIDRYGFHGKAGQTVVAELASRSIGGKGNAVLALYDADQNLLASNNDFDGQSDPLVAYTLPADGRYSLQVNELTMLGGKDFDYRLSIGEFPYVVACYPLSVPADRESHVELIGHNLPPKSRVAVKGGAAGEVAVPIDIDKYRGARDLKVLIASAPEGLESEPNDRPADATTIAAPGGANGRIEGHAAEQALDVDHYRFTAKKGEQWIIETAARRRGSPVDTRIDVLTTDGQPIERLLLQAVRDSYIDFRTINSTQTGVRLKNWEEMELNEFVYFAGEVSRLFRAPQGPDSDSLLYESTPGVRRTYFDTSATTHANYDPAYIVESHAPGAKLAFNGLPVFPLYYSNDDASDREIGTDSRVTFTAPADGTYLVRVTDTAGRGGERYVYRLSIRQPRPDFMVRIDGENPKAPAGSGQSFTVTRQRIDGFDGDIRVDVGGALPPGFRVTTPIVIEAGHRTATGTIFAAADAQKPTDEVASNSKLTATAVIDGKTVTKEIGSLGKIALRDKPRVSVEFFPEEQPAGRAPPHPTSSAGLPQITMAPGTTVTARLKITRNGHKGAVTLEVLNLPHGVIVDNLGLNGLLITPNENERQIFITAARWVGETDRMIHAVARVAENATSAPVMFHIRKPGAVAKR
ncbi:MAG: c-type cytochrome domain-containing protein [Pirellulales bacterium]